MAAAAPRPRPPSRRRPEWAAWRLWPLLLREQHGIGYVTTSKLLARKRPRLIPVYDRVVRERTGGSDAFWSDLAEELRRDGRSLHDRLVRLRSESGVGDDISVLRVFDVIAWMPGKDQAAAIEAE